MLVHLMCLRTRLRHTRASLYASDSNQRFARVHTECILLNWLLDSIYQWNWLVIFKKKKSMELIGWSGLKSFSIDNSLTINWNLKCWIMIVKKTQNWFDYQNSKLDCSCFLSVFAHVRAFVARGVFIPELSGYIA